MAHRAVHKRQSQAGIIRCGGIARSRVDRIVSVPLADRMRMATPEAGGLIRERWRHPRFGHVRDLEVAVDTVMGLAAVGPGEQTEEEEHVADTDSLVSEVALRRTGLAEGAAARLEHGIVVAEIRCGEPTSGCSLDDLAEAEVAVGRFGPGVPNGNGDADGAAVDDRRGCSAGRAVEPLAAEDDLHSRAWYRWRLTWCRDSRDMSSSPLRIGDEIPPLSIPRTLFVLPCSGAKEEGGRRAAGHQPSILDSLPRRLAGELATKRADNRRAAKVNDVALLPAAARYSGTLYREASHAIDGLDAAGAHALIISGGYGVVLPTEPIGWYNQEYRNAMWPDALVPRCLSAYAEATSASSVVGLLSATTQYARAFRAARWPVRIESVFLACPEPTTGARVKTPRALGEAFVALSRDHRLRPGWRSSDGLGMQVAKLK